MAEQIKTPWGEIGYITFKRTYARRLKENDPNSASEEFEDVINRELEASDSQLKVGFTEEEKKGYYNTRLGLKWSVAGRFMWQLGTKTVKKLGLPSLQNCAFTVVNDPIKPFTWAMDMLMLGSGVGYNIQRHNVYTLPKVGNKVKIQRVDGNDVDFIIPDNREGWIELLERTLRAHFFTGKGFTYSAHCVRSKGAPIKSFGGVASGPDELCDGIAEVSKILNARAGKKLRPIDCLDIMNIIGHIVVSGNVRRSAQLAIGDHDDLEYLKAKRWDLGVIPKWRGMSNNSIAAPDDLRDLPKEYWETYQQGEPYGLINLALSRAVGRTGETQYADPEVEGYNPCAEQSLGDKETCCLAEVFLPNINNYEELLQCLGYAYRMCKHSLMLNCHLKDTEDIVHRLMRMGLGQTGYLQCPEEKKAWLKDAYVWLRNLDNEYSDLMGWPRSVKLTTMKPSGTLSSLAGVTPGGNCGPAGPWFIRRIRIASNSPLIEVCRQHGYKIEPCLHIDGSIDPNTMVVEFPMRFPEGTPVASNTTWRDQLDTIRRLQREWSDNSVSCTVTYRKEDIEDIKEYLNEHFKNEIKTVSFLLFSDHGFKQAPYEDITENEYLALVSRTRPITSGSVKESDFELQDCEGGACPIK